MTRAAQKPVVLPNINKARHDIRKPRPIPRRDYSAIILGIWSTLTVALIVRSLLGA